MNSNYEILGTQYLIRAFITKKIHPIKTGDFGVLRDELRIIKKKKLTELKKYVIECSDSWHADNGVNLDANYR
ncbi:MAG: hypothetical protein V3U87_14145, partial [Methylococcaceae bacterium]